MSLEIGYAKYLTPAEVEEVAKSFRIFDQDNSGSISIRVLDAPVGVAVVKDRGAEDLEVALAVGEFASNRRVNREEL